MENSVIKKHRPRVMIAAASSASGKTVITSAVLASLKRKGISLSSFKCGPDYIDPMFHQSVLGIASLNLDPFFENREGIKRLVATSSGNLSVIEGVMGIYDGIRADSREGSGYDIAKMTDTPVILIVNAAGSGMTIVSVIKGIISDDDSHLIKGIILNRMTESFFKKLRPYLESELSKIRDDICVIGCIPKDDAFDLKSRHLGLILPHEIKDMNVLTDSAADVMERYCDIAKIRDIAGSAPDISYVLREDDTGRASEPSVRIAVAKDEAFCFYYRENIRLLERLGAKPVYFSPLHDERIPENVSGILLGGGYPELYLKELSANISMKDSIKKAVGSGMPSLAECGGFMYLHDTIVSPNGKEYEMCGIISGKCMYSGHLANFGYARITDAPGRTFIGMKCHEFHYYTSTNEGEDVELEKESSGRKYRSMKAGSAYMWGFAHLYYPSDVPAIENFVRNMRNYGGNRNFMIK